MDTALMELDDIRSSLSGSIGMLLVLADGLDGYTRSMSFSDTRTEAYVNALFLAYDTLDTLTREFGEVLERARGEGKGGSASAGSSMAVSAEKEAGALRGPIKN